MDGDEFDNDRDALGSKISRSSRCGANGTSRIASGCVTRCCGSERSAIVIVDLREASFFDSTALAELIALYKRLSGAGRRFEAFVGDSNMRRLLELTSLDVCWGFAGTRAAI